MSTTANSGRSWFPTSNRDRSKMSCVRATSNQRCSPRQSHRRWRILVAQRAVSRHVYTGAIAKSIEDHRPAHERRQPPGKPGAEKKYFVLLRQPQSSRRRSRRDPVPQTGNPPRRRSVAGIIPRDPRSPGQTLRAGHRVPLTDPLPYLNTWCEMNGESYWIDGE